jgi:hypothetical protein
MTVYPRNPHRSSLTPMKSVELQTAMSYLRHDCLVCICDQFQCIRLELVRTVARFGTCEGCDTMHVSVCAAFLVTKVNN